MSAAYDDFDCELENAMEEVMNITPHLASEKLESTGNASNLVGIDMFVGGHESARYGVHVLTCFAIHFIF